MRLSSQRGMSGAAVEVRHDVAEVATVCEALVQGCGTGAAWAVPVLWLALAALGALSGL